MLFFFHFYAPCWACVEFPVMLGTSPSAWYVPRLWAIALLESRAEGGGNDTGRVFVQKRREQTRAPDIC